MRQTSDDGIVIAGGGLAGQRCAETLRRSGHDGPVRLVCEEAHRPYDRPPLSKALLEGSVEEDSLAYRAEGWYERQEVDLVLGVRATGLIPAERAVLLSDGRRLRYHRLLIATGSRPRMLPLLAGYENVSTLRTIGDSRRLRAVLGGPARLAVIGAGFIGQEVAATARRLGCAVTMIEAAPTPLHGVLGHELGDWFARLHRAEGVEVITGRTVTRASGNGSVSVLTLSDGRRLEVDHVLVGVGVAPDHGWLERAGVCPDGCLKADAHGRTDLPDVFAGGDAATSLDPVSGRYRAGSHWEAAARQGARAARLMVGLDPGEAPVSSFWTDQYGLRIQYLGHAPGADGLELDGDPGTRCFTATFTRAGRPVAALLVNRPRDLPAARKSIENGVS